MPVQMRVIVWFSVFFCINLLYIGYEFAFNAQLVDVAGNIYIDAQRLHQLEITSRLLSGTGLALSLLGWFRLQRRHYTVSLPIFILTFALCIPLMYVLQSRLVEYLVNDYFSPEDRQTAQYASLLKSGIEHDNLRLDGVAFDPALKEAPEQNTFLALIGGVVFNSEALMRQLKNNRNDIASVFVHNYVVDHEEEYWQKYQESYQVLRQQWPIYQDATRRYVQAVNQIDAGVAQAWLEVNKELSKGWETYKNAVSEFAVPLNARIPDITSQLSIYFTERQHCYLEDCFTTLDEAYRTKIREQLGREIDPQYWLTEKDAAWRKRYCHEQDNEEICEGTFIDIDVSQGWFDEGEQYAWDPAPEVLIPKLLLLADEEFIHQTGGYGVSINSQEAFIAHPHTAILLRKQLAGEGILLPDDWRIAKDRVFVEAVTQMLSQKIKRTWDEELTQQLGYTMEPNLNFNEFMNTPHIQQRMREILGEYYVSGARPNFTRREFYQKLLLPLVARYTTKMAEQLNAPATEFAKDGKYADRSRQYLKLLVIPPVAMFFSLFFGMIAMIKLPTLLLAIYDGWRGNRYTQLAFKFKMVFLIPAAILLLIIPTQILTNKFSENDSGFQVLLNEVKSKQPILGHAMEWMIRIQPLVYPFGSKVNEVIQPAGAKP